MRSVGGEGSGEIRTQDKDNASVPAGVLARY